MTWLGHVFDHPDAAGALVIALKAAVVYAFLVAGLRLLGKRELGQMNLYDLVLIVVLGNAVQNAMMNGDNTLVGGLIAAGTLLVLNKALNMVIRRSRRVEKALVGHAVLILNEGRPMLPQMRAEGVSFDQLMQALREHGLTRPEEAHLAILEVDGTISVVPKGASVLQTKRHFKAIRLP